jgi:hypothetical protein
MSFGKTKKKFDFLLASTKKISLASLLLITVDNKPLKNEYTIHNNTATNIK